MTTTAPPAPRLAAHNNYVAVRLLDSDNFEVRTPLGTLLIPHANGKAVVYGVVESVGPYVTEPIAPGDLALVPPYGFGTRMDFNHRPYLLILDYDILGIWPQGDAHDGSSQG